ncbi:MAG: aspA [Holophagaceae bacterium]|nr:aspA [Holophagaceae bacterium]
MDAITTVLRRCEIFSGLSDADLSLIARAAHRREVPAGTRLFTQGEPRRGAVVIAEGRVEITRDNGEGAEPVVILGPGDVAGEQSFLAVSSHTATGTTRTAAVLLDLDRDSVLQSLGQDGAAAIAVLSKVANVLHQRLLYSATPRTGREQAYASGHTRRESDLIGPLEVPEGALFGVQTLRAVHNFPITGTPTSHFPAMIRALAMVKQGAARANARLGQLEQPIAQAIDTACQEIIDGHWHGHFPTDMVQGGAGTSTNMNANEVIANRALELLGHKRGDYAFCHPNDHVNLGQSTNDVYPTALRLSTIFMLKNLLEAMDRLKEALHAKGREFSDVIKMGRTQLQDAVPMTLGQEFEAYAVTTGEDIERLRETARLFLEVNMGGTAIGTGICADPRYPEVVVEELRKVTGLDIVLAANLLPPMQPGSSIMPGKVNPVIPEVVNQVAYMVIGNDLTITLAAEAGQLQLNVMEPILAYSLATSMRTLTSAVNVLTTKCITGITANRERCRDLVEHSIGIVTAVMPAIGYKRATEVAKEALETGVPVRELILRKGYLTAAELDEVLSLEAMTQPRPMR